jgi:DNA end-binding protein Ku
VVFTSREPVIALEPRGKVMMGLTLRYPYEVRKEQDYFDDIEHKTAPKDMLDLAVHIVETKLGKFKPERFDDKYEDALKALVKKKQKGETIEPPKAPAESNVVNLMDALRGSLAAKTGHGKTHKRPASAGRRHTPASTRHKKAS